jgi:ribosomal protein L24
MKSYIVQIDELNTKNQELTAENIKVRTEYYKEQTNNKELSQKNEELTTKVTKAAAIKTKNLRYRLLNKKGKETTKLSKIDKVEICFTLTENEITPSGTKDVYLRIARPDELVLASSAEDFFMFQGAKIAYTAKRQVDYQNKDVDMCVYWANKAEDLIPGKYIVDIFADGNLIGSINFELK